MTRRLMQAVRVHAFGGADVLRVENVAVPAPGAGQVLVQIHAAGINPVDAYICSGNYPIQPDLPYTPGQDAAGVIAAVGKDVVGIAVGDRVYTTGTISGSYADYAVCEAGQVWPLPLAVTFPQGACLGIPYTTAWRALFQRGRAQAGETVLVHGATGGVGLAATQIAAAAGLRVYATGGSEEGRDRLLEERAVDVFNHHSKGYLERIEARSGGVDLVLEMLANVNLDRDLDPLRVGGRVVIIGSRGRVEIDPRKLMEKESSVRGVMLSSATPNEMRSSQAGIEAGLVNGSLAPVIKASFELSNAAKAHRQVMDPNTSGKIVLLTNEGKK